MLIHRLLARYFDQADGGDKGGGGGAGGADKGAGDAAAAAAAALASGDKPGDKGTGDKGAGDGKGDGKGDKTLLESLGKGEGDKGAGEGDKKELTPEQKAIAAAEKDTRRPKEVPSKYWDAEKGAVKFDAWAKSTTELEGRMRAYGLPPKDASEYKFEIPKELKEVGIDLDPAMAKTFRDQAHEIGLTQKQYERVMGLYFGHVKGLADQVSQFSVATARAELLGHYKTEEDLSANVRRAYQAFAAYADEKDMALIDRIGNIPAVIRVLAKVGAELAEDTGANPEAILDAESLTQLMRGAPGKEDSPYWNASDPRHASTIAKVGRHHAAQAAARQRKAA